MWLDGLRVVHWFNGMILEIVPFYSFVEGLPWKNIPTSYGCIVSISLLSSIIQSSFFLSIYRSSDQYFHYLIITNIIMIIVALIDTEEEESKKKENTVTIVLAVIFSVVGI